MDKKKGLLNVGVSIALKVLIIFAEIFARRFLINYIGNEVNGLNSLYVSILDFLSIAELGVGSAITYCMYKPIVAGEKEKVAALYRLFNKLYLIIGAIIAVVGCAIMPLLPYFAKDYQELSVNLYLTFGLMLISVVITYLFSAKTSLINAYKNNYITVTISSVGRILQCGMQMLVLFLTQSFVWYLVCRIIVAALQWLVTEIIARRFHGDIIKIKASVSADTKKEVSKNVRAMFMHKIGSVLVNTADGIIISAFIGLSIYGKYSNYITIVTAMSGVLGLCFSPLTSVIGHMILEENNDAVKRYFRFFHTLNFVLGIVFFLGYFSVASNLVSILFKNDLELDTSIVFVITLNYFIQFMRQAAMLFRDATGTFYNDRWKPIVEGVVNIGLSILFVKVFPEGYNVVGVIVATIITNVFICHIVEPYVLYKHALKTSVKRYYLTNYLYMLIFAGALAAMHFAMVDIENQWVELIANGFISIGISAAICLIVCACNKDFRHYAKQILSKLKTKKSANVQAAAAATESDGSILAVDSLDGETVSEQESAIADEGVAIADTAESDKPEVENL